jgi:hypothetical protein
MMKKIENNCASTSCPKESRHDRRFAALFTTALCALLSIVTSLVSLSQSLEEFIPWSARSAAATDVMTAFQDSASRLF